MAQVGAFPINSAHHQVPTREANVVADALNRSQRKLEEGSTDDSIVVVVMIEIQISALSGVSMELTTNDLQKWSTT